MGLLIKLQNGDTALKSLKFGSDRPGGGDSGQPYIQNPIKESTTPLDQDSIIRGGLKATTSTAEDVTRLTKYFFDTKNPSGFLFTTKQNILSRTAAKTEASKGLGYGGGLINEGIYTPLSTLSEAGVVAFGGHLNKQGLDPTGLFSGLGIKKYQEVISSTQLSGRIDLENNRLIKLTTNISENKSSGLNFIPGYYLNKGESLISYGGGDGSILGIGKTHIKFATDNAGIPIKTLKPLFNPKTYQAKGKSKDKIEQNKFQTPIGASEKYIYSLSNANLTSVSESGQYLVFDGRNSYQYNFNNSVYDSGSLNPRKDYKSYLTGSTRQPENTLFILPLGASEKYNNIQIQKSGSSKVQFEDLIQYDLTSEGKNSYQETTLLETSSPPTTYLTHPGTYIPVSASSLQITGSIKADKPLDGKIYYNSKSLKRTSKSLLTGSNDLISFNFAIINPQDPSNPTKTLNFRAYLDSLSDSYSNDWSSQTYMGRAEKFYKYNSFDRSISLGFTIVADNKTNLGEMYSQLNTLASSIAPFYTSQGYMAGTLHKLTIGNYIKNQWGILQGLTFDVMDESPWEIDSGDQLPLYIKVTGIKFTPIHNFRPEALQGKYIKQ